MADIKNFGIKGIASDVQMGKSGGRLKYDSGNSRFDLTQSDGSTLENIRIGTLESGTWNGDAIATGYGGVGVDISAATGVLQVNAGTGSAGNISLSDSNFIDTTSNLAIAQGGTGATTSADARTNLGLGNLAVQADNAVAITGGNIDGTIIGASTAAAITGTTITANSGFVGDVTGNVSGNAGTADAWSTARDFGLAGDATGNVSVDGSGDITLTTTLANTAVTAGVYGSATLIPQITVDSKGRITAASNVALSTGFDIAGDNGSNDTVNGGETLSIVGTAGQTETTITNNQVAVGIVDGASIANLTVTGTFTSDDITSSQVTVDGDATITGNLTVQGTQTTVNSTTVETADAIFRTNSNGAATDAGFEANTASGVKQILYTNVGAEWDFGSENVNAATFTGNVTGDVTGSISGANVEFSTGLSDGTITIANFIDDDTMATASDTTLPTSESVVAYIGTQNAAQDLDFSGDSGTGAVLVDSQTLAVTGAQGIATSASGTGLTVTLSNTAVTAGAYGNATAIPTITVDAQGRITDVTTNAISTSWTLSDGSTSETIDGGDTLTVSSDSNTTATVSATDTLTIGLAANIAGLNSVSASTLTDGTLSIASGNITSGVAATFSGQVEGGTLTDGSLTINSGNIANGVDGTFSGTVEGGTLTDGTATLTAANLAGVVNITASGVVEFGSLTDGTTTIASIVTESGNISSNDNDTTIPTSAAVVDFVTKQLTKEDLDFSGDSGTGAVDLDSQTLAITGGTGIETSASGQGLTVTLSNTAVTAKTYGSTTEIPVITVNAQGQITSASNATIATSFDIAGDNGSNDTVNGGETLSIVGTAGQTETTITNNQVAIGIVDGASIANLTVTGTFTSDDITSSAISIAGDATITGNLTVQGTQTVVDSTTVQTADAIFRVNSNGTTGANVGFEANVGGDMKSIVYLPSGSWSLGAEDLALADIAASGNVVATASVEGATLTDGTLSINSGNITSGVAATFSGQVSGGTLTDGTLSSTAGNITNAVNITASGAVSFGSLTDSGESITVTKFVDEADGISSNDNDTTIPTSAAVRDYVDNNSGDGLLLRTSFTADSSNSTFDVGTVPNVSGRTYYADKLVLKVSTGFSGGSVNAVKITENGTSGTTLVAVDDADVTTVGTYIIELDGSITLTKNAAVTAEFVESDGSTASTPTGGTVVASLHYNYV